MMTKRSNYPLKTLAIGQYFDVPLGWDTQHVRVSASEYGRATGKVFTCRKQDDGSMRVYRIEPSQRDIDRRGRNSMRVIPQPVALTLADYTPLPNEQEFSVWLDSLHKGAKYTMGRQYAHGYALMATWTVNHALRTGSMYATSVDEYGALVIIRN